jgi:BlaI family transcriptional regulator, penicillinase repressor
MSVSFTERELDIMAVLWEHGPSTASEVRQKLKDQLAYNTVLTMLGILEQKGYVEHTEVGRTFRFHPLVDRETAGKSAIKRLVDTVFGGSDELLLTHLVQEQKLGRKKLERLRQMLHEHLQNKEGPK